MTARQTMMTGENFEDEGESCAKILQQSYREVTAREPRNTELKFK